MGEPGAERRHFLPLEQIPKRMQDALLAVEDANFYEHGGVSYTGVLRGGEQPVQQAQAGCPTITRSWRAISHLTKRQLYSRKSVEALLAFKIESQPMEKILEVWRTRSIWVRRPTASRPRRSPTSASH